MALAAGPVTLDLEACAITVGAGDPVHLTRTQRTLLQAFMLHPGKLMSKDRIAVLMYGDDAYEKSEKLVDVYICKLRRKLAQAGAPAIISTVWGEGYRFVCEPDCITRSFTPATWQRIKDIAEREGITL
jgi:two-component system cell cycle response regulator CtrA